MKELILMRHAKSSWADEGASDHARRLNDRGKQDGPAMGRLLKEQSLVPNQIISSTANRARTTAALVAAELGEDVPITEIDELYLAPPATYLHLATNAEATVSRLLLIGHNPGIETFASALLGSFTRMPTAAVVYCQFEVENWGELPARHDAGGFRISRQAVWRPKEI